MVWGLIGESYPRLEIFDSLTSCNVPYHFDAVFPLEAAQNSTNLAQPAAFLSSVYTIQSSLLIVETRVLSLKRILKLIITLIIKIMNLEKLRKESTGR